jgi:hypothetical protein
VIVNAFQANEELISSQDRNLQSDQVLARLAPLLTDEGFRVETGKKTAQKIRVPVLFGRNGRVQKFFEADAWHPDDKLVLEVEAGRGVTNNQFLKDLFQACMMHDIDYLGVAVRNDYRTNPDHQRMVEFFETLYASDRMRLPLRGVLTVGY